jgi:hypothetical protein
LCKTCAVGFGKKAAGITHGELRRLITNYVQYLCDIPGLMPCAMLMLQLPFVRSQSNRIPFAKVSITCSDRRPIRQRIVAWMLILLAHSGGILFWQLEAIGVPTFPGFLFVFRAAVHIVHFILYDN